MTENQRSCAPNRRDETVPSGAPSRTRTSASKSARGCRDSLSDAARGARSTSGAAAARGRGARPASAATAARGGGGTLQKDAALHSGDGDELLFQRAHLPGAVGILEIALRK